MFYAKRRQRFVAIYGRIRGSREFFKPFIISGLCILYIGHLKI